MGVFGGLTNPREQNASESIAFGRLIGRLEADLKMQP